MDTTIIFSIMLTFKIILVIISPLLLVALLTAYLSLRKNLFLDYIIDFVINIPLIFPPIGIGFFLVMLFSKNSFLARLFNFDLIFSFTGIAIASFLAGFPFITRSVISGIKNGVYELCEVSYTLGKSNLETFLLVVIPSLRKNILHGLILAIGRVLGEVGMSLMIGGNIQNRTNTISLEIYNAVLDGENQKAVILSVILFIFSFSIFFSIKALDRE